MVGADAVVVLVVGHVADIAQDLDQPVAADQGEDAGLVRPVRRWAEHPVADFAPLAAPTFPVLRFSRKVWAA
ncbi:MAG TPA: hypothetical protein DCM14_02430 [Clostridiales bacterium UBA8153]|nr:hypothetical protein [Clostridiales bacterium UBA8153]